MPTHDNTGYQGGKKKRPTTTVTVHHDGRVTAKGPGAKAAKHEAEASQERVARAVAETNNEYIPNAPTKAERRKHERLATEENLHEGTGLADLGKTLLKAAQVENPGGPGVRKFVGDEAKSLWKAARESQRQQGHSIADYKGPSKNQVSAALTEASLIPVADAGAGAKALSKAASAASDASSARNVAAKVVAKVKAAPKQAAKAAREAPAKKVKAIKSAPRRAKATVKRAPELKTKAGQKAAAKAAGRSARRHPVRSSYLGAAALPPGTVPGEIGERARGAVVGSVDALVNHPGETLKTTARALPAAITGPVALGAAAVDSAVHGTTKPLEHTASEQAKGIGQILGNTFSGDPKKAEEAARKEGSLSLLVPLPAVTKAKPFKAAEGAVRDTASAARRKVAATSESANRRVRHAPEGQPANLFGVTARHDARKRVSLIKARTDNPHRVAAAEHTNNILNALHKAPPGSHVALQTLAEYGIRDKKGADLIRKKGPGDPQLIAALDYADLHPQIFGDKHMVEALGHLKKSVEGTAGTKSGKGERARLLAQGDALGIPRPEHVVPVGKRGEFGDRTWAEAVTELKEVLKGQRKALREASGKPEPRTTAVPSVVDVKPRRPRVSGGPLEQFRGVSDSRIPFEFNEKTGELRLGQQGYSHAEMGWERTAADPNWKQGEINLADPKQPVFGFGGKLLSKSQREALVALREHTGLDIRTLDQWRGGQVPRAIKGSTAKRKQVEADLERTVKMLKEAKKGAARKANSTRTRSQWITDADGAKRKVKTSVAPYGDRELAQYKERVESAREAAGLDKAIWTHHASASGDKGAGIANKFPTPAGRKEYAREGTLAKAGELDRSLEGLVRGTIHQPRLRAAGKEFTRNLVDEFKLPVKIDGKETYVIQGSKDWHKVTQRKTKDNPDGGQYDAHSVARFAYREFNNAINDPFLSETQRDATLLQILKDAETNRTPGSEPSVLMPREAIKEARAQINPEHNILTEGMNKFAHVSNRLILGTNPAWAIAQTVAEGVPMLISHPNLANPIYLSKLIKETKAYGDAHPELRATAGVSPLNGAALRQPGEMIESYTPEQWSKGADAMTRGKLAKGAISFAKLRALGEFDVRRQNAYRKAIYAAERDRKFRSWHSGLTGLFDGAAAISKRFKGKSHAEVEDWLNTTKEGQAWKAKLEDHVDAIEGNWTAFTRYERALAPFTIFYPFLRYSLRWTLWAFPKEHPIRATVLALMGQANSNQLEKLVGGPIQNPAAYAFPVWQDQNGESQVLPGGSRISPGQSSLTQALATGNPASVLSSANPFLGAGITATTGVEPFTGEEASGPRGLAALEQLMNLPRPASVKIGGKSLTERGLGALGLGQERSAASKAFEQFDQRKGERSLLMPFIPQSGKDFAGAEKLGKAFDDKYSNPVPSLPAEIWEAAYNEDWKLAKELRAKRLKAEKGGDITKKAEEPFFEDSGGKLSKQGSEILKYITGTIQIPVESPKEKRQKEEERNPFGIPSADPSKLREEFGIESTSKSALKEQFGIK